MSLAYLNLVQHEGQNLSEDYLARMERAWGPVRVCVAAARERGDEVLGPLYTAIGNRWHGEQRRGTEALQEALVEAGLPESLVASAEDGSLDDEVKASHHRGMDQVGIDVGTPIISVDGRAFFGPVVTPIPRGEAAGKLWDGVLLVTGTDGFFELKRNAGPLALVRLISRSPQPFGAGRWNGVARSGPALWPARAPAPR